MPKQTKVYRALKRLRHRFFSHEISRKKLERGVKRIVGPTDHRVKRG